MFVVTHHHSYDEVLLGPIDWKPEFISSVIEQDLDLDYRPKILKSDIDKIPYEVVPNVFIREIVQTKAPEINHKTQFLTGPYWSYNEQGAVAVYKEAYKDIDIVKSELKSIVSSERYIRETSGFQFSIDSDNTVYISTGRESRSNFFDKLSVIEENTINFKFGDKFIIIDKLQLQQICNQIDNHIQQSFDWERQLFSNIDRCTTHAELDSIVIVTPKEENTSTS
jgi:hypothetical protein